jgi:hypothetical protein
LDQPTLFLNLATLTANQLDQPDTLKGRRDILVFNKTWYTAKYSEAIFLVMCYPSMNEL